MDTVVGRHQLYNNRPAREYPSFSSSLLDEIYRSIDERDDQELMVYRKTTTEKQSGFSIDRCFRNDRDVRQDDIAGNNGRAYLIEKWMDKEVCEKVVFKRRSQQHPREGNSLNYFNSSSSSSDSSCGGGFSSSEAESVYGASSSRPKPIRTGTNRHDEYSQKYQLEDLQSKPKHEGKFVKTKSKAMKIYGDLKKAKQPISPGGRLAAFLNSLFTNGGSTKNNTKLPSSSSSSSASALGYDIDRKSKSTNASTTCSSASSFSRSCLSKTPSSRGKLSNSKMRSVRFYPVSVIVDEDCQPCGHKSLYEEQSNSNLQNPQSLKFVKNPTTEGLKSHSSEKNRKIEEAARNLLRNYQKKVDLMTNSVKSHNEIDMNSNEEEEDDEDDDDAASHASSDLFELENFSAIGMEKYRDELPVYETTHLDSNFAIGNGFLM